MTPGPGHWLRALSWLLLRGEAAPIVRGDLEESLRRDIAAGVPLRRARVRYLRNLLGSAWSLARPHRPRRRNAHVSWLDVKLGLRMLIRHRGLTLVAVFALALGIPASLVPLHLFNTFSSELPFEEGERIVGLRYLYVEVLEDHPGSAFEYNLWRDRLSGIEDVAAAQPARFNVVTGDGQVSPVTGSQMTASAFRLLRVPPLLGRPLADADEIPGAPPVVVLGYDLWRSGFMADPDVVGTTMLVAGQARTIVGVMPEGFLFPIHDGLWVPLQTGSVVEPGSGPDLLIFGRLAEGVSAEQLATQMESLHLGQAERFPEALGSLRPHVSTFLELVTGNAGSSEDRGLLAVMQVFTLLLLTVACGNVGTLILARTSARAGELATRTALGASRGRIVGQLFVESLVLALVATAVGLGVAYQVSSRFGEMVMSSGNLPFWIDFRLGHRTVIQAFALSVFCAVVAGVVPAMKATGAGIQSLLQRASAGVGGVRFGGLTTSLIVAEVALGVACVFAGSVALEMAPSDTVLTEVRTDQVLSAEVQLARPAGLPADVAEGSEERTARVASVHDEVVRRLRSEPGVQGATLAISLPGTVHQAARIEVEGAGRGEDGSGERALVGLVGVGYFEALGAPVVEGRPFRESDLDTYELQGDAPVVINTTFADRVLEGRNPIGQRIRYLERAGEEPGRWYVIVGVAPRLGMYGFDGTGNDAGLYHPIRAGQHDPVSIVTRVDSDLTAWVPRLREIVSAIDPSTLVEQPMTLSDLVRQGRIGLYWALLAAGVVAGIAIVLSVAGLYALMSFTVVQRTQEIGLRAALGADAGPLVWLIARRAMLQLVIGVAIGVALSLLFVRGAAPELFTWIEVELSVVQAGALVLVIGALSCVAPTLRGLRIRPMDALRVDG